MFKSLSYRDILVITVYQNKNRCLNLLKFQKLIHVKLICIIKDELLSRIISVQDNRSASSWSYVTVPYASPRHWRNGPNRLPPYPTINTLLPVTPGEPESPLSITGVPDDWDGVQDSSK